MQDTSHHDAKIAKMSFASVYPHYVTKVEKKGRSESELLQVITWLTGFDEVMIRDHIAQRTAFEQFFEHAELPDTAYKITGTICGYKVEEITNTLTQRVRYLDKLVDELAKGRPLEKILRS